MIVRVTLIIDTKAEVILFGDDYKSWQSQLREFCGSAKTKPKEILRFEKSTGKLGCFGLKSCPEGEYQNELNKENPKNPRQYKHFRFQDFTPRERFL
jgi:hypothetical protein